MGFAMPQEKQSIIIPFEVVNNLIIIPVTINRRVTLKFILDTGANNLILTERLFGDAMGLIYDRTILISGPGIVDSVRAHVANDVTINLPGGIIGRHMSMLVLEEDYIKLKENLGEDIYGIIGYDVFSRFVVKIDYEREQLILYNPSSFRPPKRCQKIPLDVDNTKPYVAGVIHQNSDTDTMKFMVDTGASHAVLLDVDESKILVKPDSTLTASLGHGLGGEIIGEIGRFDKFMIGEYELNNILVSMPDAGLYSNIIKRGSKYGTIGGLALIRFKPIFDYHNGFLYLRKSTLYKSRFSHDMSGLRITYKENPQRFEITAITENSPAKNAGFQKGDIIKSVNGMTIYNATLSEIIGVLRQKDGRKIRITVERDKEVIRYKFYLRKMI
jgi:hypothetical protein